MRIRTVAKEGALEALAASKPGVAARHATRAGAGQGRGRPAVGGGQGDGRQADAGGGKRRLGLSGRVPRRVDAATKAGLLELDRRGPDGGWTLRRACRDLELGESRVHRWRPAATAGRGRQAAGRVARCTGCSPRRWPRSWRCSTSGARSTARTASWPTAAPTWVGCGSRRPACGGCCSWLTSISGRVARPGRSVRKPFPDWVEYPPEPDLDLRHHALHRAQVWRCSSSRTWSRASGSPRSSRRRRPPPRSSSSSPTHWIPKASSTSIDARHDRPVDPTRR